MTIHRSMSQRKDVPKCRPFFEMIDLKEDKLPQARPPKQFAPDPVAKTWTVPELCEAYGWPKGLEGGGIHQSTRGGFLNIHADFTVHPHQKNWQRRVNVLVYLNNDWHEEWGGKLELWDRKMKACEESVLPVYNRCVIFNTDAEIYGGSNVGNRHLAPGAFDFRDDDQSFVVRIVQRERGTAAGANRGMAPFDRLLDVLRKVVSATKHH